MAAIPDPLFGALVEGFAILPPTRAGGYRIVLPPSLGSVMVERSGRENAQGEAAPCLSVCGRSGFRFRFAVSTGSFSVSVRAKQSVAAYARPRLILHANPDLGIERAEMDADAGEDWVTVGPIDATASADGGVVVELHNPEPGRVCYFDNLTVA